LKRFQSVIANSVINLVNFNRSVNLSIAIMHGRSFRKTIGTVTHWLSLFCKLSGKHFLKWSIHLPVSTAPQKTPEVTRTASMAVSDGIRGVSSVHVAAPSVHRKTTASRPHLSYRRPDMKEPPMKPSDHMVKMALAVSRSAATSIWSAGSAGPTCNTSQPWPGKTGVTNSELSLLVLLICLINTRSLLKYKL